MNLRALSILLALPLCAFAGSSRPSQNAAVKYLRAHLTLRDGHLLPTDAPSALDRALNSPIDDSDRKLVASAREALIEFEHGSELKHCNWELSGQDGPSADTSRRDAIRELVLLAGLRASVRFRDKDADSAIKDALASITAARYLSQDGTIASVLISYQLEREISNVLIRNLPGLTSSQLRRLKTGLSSTPPEATMAEALRAEQIERHPFVTLVHGAPTRDELITQVAKGIPLLNDDSASAQKLVDECGGSVRGVDECVQQQQAFCKSWIARFSLPPDQFEKDYQHDLATTDDSNPLIARYTPKLSTLRWEEAYSRTRRALLQAAIAVELDGPAALIRFNDPYQNDFFAYLPLEHGFRLDSELTEEGAPISVSVTSDSH